MPKSKTNLTKSQLAMKTRSHKSVSIALSEFETKDIEELDLTGFFGEIAIRTGLSRSRLIRRDSPYRPKIIAYWNELLTEKSALIHGDEVEIIARQQAMLESQTVKLSEQEHRIKILEKIILHSNLQPDDTPDNSITKLAHARKEFDLVAFAFRTLLSHVEELGILIVDGRLIDRGGGDGRINEICNQELLSGYIRWTDARK
ncbi:hypothetical protein [Pseudomonas sp. MPC6]|uniref:hypothetical protein n=1 Tax=unclassified Pseudomonas TaxID=196821 RepID=UPI001110F74C|nr:hypothetical protein [Pseudomonas sp. MPC6]QCY14123.1 hypothetical protein ELQ88_26940 [Pseudomonas sp. MPC6]